MRTVVSTTILHSKIDQFNPNPMVFQLLKGKKEKKKCILVFLLEERESW